MSSLTLENSSLQDTDTGSLTMKVEPEDYDESSAMTVQLQQLCRMCAQPCSVATSSSLLEPESAMQCQLMHCFNINVVASDGLPTRLCVSCGRELQHWEQVKSSVAQAQHFLRHQLELQGTQDPLRGTLTPTRQVNASENTEAVLASDCTVLPSVSVNSNKVRDNLNQNTDILESEHENFETITVKINPDSLLDNEENYHCSDCNQSYKDYDEFIQHQGTHNETQSVDTRLSSCINPRSSTDYIAPKNIDNRPHSPNNPFQCGICPMKFKDTFVLAIHLEAHRTKDRIKLFPCAHCNVMFKTIKILTQHQERHIKNPDEKFSHSCNICSKEFSDSKKLRMHSRVHDDVRQYKCTMCDVTYKYKGVYTEHMEKHRQGLIAIKLKTFMPMNVIQKIPTIKRDTEGRLAIAPKVINSPKPISIAPMTNNVITPNNQSGPIQYVYLPPIPLNQANQQSSLFQINITPANPSTMTCQNDVASTSTQNICNKPKKYNKVSKSDKKIAASGAVPSYAIVDDADYPCGICHLNFKDAVSFTSHVENELLKINKRIIPCGFCGAIFRKLNNLVQHTEDHKNCPEKAAGVTCKICSRTFHTYSHYEAHSRIHAEHKRFRCVHCDAAYCHKVSLKTHLQRQHKDFSKHIPEVDSPSNKKNSEIRLTKTTSTSNTKINLSQIVLEPEVIPSGSSEIQSNVIIINQSLESSKIKDEDVIKQERQDNRFKKIEKLEHFSCNICNYKFFSQKSLYDHYLEKHIIKEKELICPLCSTLYESNELLLTHLKTHAQERKHFCPICDKVFRQKAAMREHIPLHSFERNYQCEICTWSFRSRSYLFYHKKNVHGNETFLCEFCSKVCKSKPVLKSHILKHTRKDMTFICSVCSKTFTTKQYLRKHEFIHKDTKPLRCLKCKKGFIDPYFWRIHMRKKCNVPEEDITYFRKTFP